MDGAPDLRQERLYMCTDCNLAFYGENGEAEWQWHLKQHQPYKCDLCDESFEQKRKYFLFCFLSHLLRSCVHSFVHQSVNIYIEVKFSRHQ